MMHALDLVGLTERATDVVATFSGGMQRRLNLACALLHRPRVLLLDEPTVGVDPQSRERILEAVRDQARGGAAVLYSTHYMDEAERLCDRVVLIDDGRVVADGTPAELIRGAEGGVRLVRRDAAPRCRPAGSTASPARARCRSPGARPRAATASEVAARRAAARRARPRARRRHGGEVLEFHVHQPELQDVFLQLTGRALRD